MHHTIAQNAADGGYTKKFVARNVVEVGRDSTAAILCATNFGVDTQCNSAIARNIAPCIRAFKQEVPHSMLEDKEDKAKAINKYKRWKEMETVIIPPTCTGTLLLCLLKWHLTCNDWFL